jgi:hypothetical protein
MSEEDMTRTLTISALLVTIVLAAQGGMLGHSNVKPPAASEFGTGPRTSTRGLYVAQIITNDTFKPRKMYTIRVDVKDANGKPIDDAAILVGGGMPQHGHGLPTQPRVTANAGNGIYEISGLRFNMGGWWELKLTITTAAGTDTVTFNLSL